MSEFKFLNLDNINKAASKMVDDNPHPQLEVVEDPPKRKRGRPRKSESNMSNTATIVVSSDNKEPTNLPLCETNEPYGRSYDETNNMLRYSIAQIDTISNDVKNELDNVRKSKTLKGKYKYISDLCATASSLISTKVSAIREINSSTTNSLKLELQRAKDNKASAMMNQQDDDKYIADLYNAYINTPVNAGASSVFTNMSPTNNPALIGGIPINTSSMSEEQNYQNYLQNMTPEQNRMLIGDNPNIETVVVYDPNTGDKSFDVIDTSTGIPVPNYPRPDPILLDDTIIDFQSGIASNSNLGQNWKVVVLGDVINNF